MEASKILTLALVGMGGGVLSGLFGIGGGVVLVPALVYVLGVSQATAQGTTLAMLMLPVVALGVWRYYQQGHVRWEYALMMAVGFVVGGYLGARWATALPPSIHVGSWEVHEPLKKLFALLVLVLAVRMLLK